MRSSVLARDVAHRPPPPSRIEPAAIARPSTPPSPSPVSVSALETIVSKGRRVVDADVVTLTEALMNELVKLDSIVADGEVKEQRRLQKKRVQKYIEALDAIRAKTKKATAPPKARPPRPPPAQQPQQRRQF
uniref:BAG domain-containing protein n=1 Tax=Oryza glumipatula TaxID=40148 RepID=A0A0D9Z900_9ORYZ